MGPIHSFGRIVGYQKCKSDSLPYNPRIGLHFFFFCPSLNEAGNYTFHSDFQPRHDRQIHYFFELANFPSVPVPGFLITNLEFRYYRQLFSTLIRKVILLTKKQTMDMDSATYFRRLPFAYFVFSSALAVTQLVFFPLLDYSIAHAIVRQKGMKEIIVGYANVLFPYLFDSSL